MQLLKDQQTKSNVHISISTYLNMTSNTSFPVRLGQFWQHPTPAVWPGCQVKLWASGSLERNFATRLANGKKHGKMMKNDKMTWKNLLGSNMFGSIEFQETFFGNCLELLDLPAYRDVLHLAAGFPWHAGSTCHRKCSGTRHQLRRPAVRRNCCCHLLPLPVSHGLLRRKGEKLQASPQGFNSLSAHVFWITLKTFLSTFQGGHGQSKNPRSSASLDQFWVASLAQVGLA